MSRVLGNFTIKLICTATGYSKLVETWRLFSSSMVETHVSEIVPLEFCTLEVLVKSINTQMQFISILLIPVKCKH